MPPKHEPTLGEFAHKAIAKAAPGMSEARAKLTVRLLVQVAEQQLATAEQREFWIALIGVESGYVGNRVSSVGATGLGQIMPKLAADIAAKCGLGMLVAPNLMDDWTNANLSACLFRKLLDENGGNIPLALASYNAGANSAGVKSLKRGGQASAETNGHVAKTWVLKEMAQ